MPETEFTPDFLFDGAGDGAPLVVLAHGAGAGMDSPFMATIAAGLAARGLTCVRFEFPYMVRRRATGTKRPPDRAPVLLNAWRRVIEVLGENRRLVIGGKSMGGRIASMIAAEGREPAVAGLVCLGYPFHPPGRPQTPRIDHLKDLAVPTLIVQGTRDPFGTRDEVTGYPLSPAIRVHWIGDGDHGLVPRKRSGFTWEANMADAADAVAGFVRGLQA